MTTTEIELAEMEVEKARERLRLAGHGERARARRAYEAACAKALKLEAAYIRHTREQERALRV